MICRFSWISRSRYAWVPILIGNQRKVVLRCPCSRRNIFHLLPAVGKWCVCMWLSKSPAIVENAKVDMKKLHMQKFCIKTRLSVSGHGRLTWIRFQLQWKVRFRKGGRYRCSEVEGLPTTPIILFVVVSVLVSRSYVTLSVSRSCVTGLFEVDIDFKNVFTLKLGMQMTCRFSCSYLKGDCVRVPLTIGSQWNGWVYGSTVSHWKSTVSGDRMHLSPKDLPTISDALKCACPESHLHMQKLCIKITLANSASIFLQYFG